MQSTTTNTPSSPEVSVERFEELKKGLEATNSRISRVEGVQAEKTKQLKEILAKYADQGVKTVADLEKLYEKRKAEAEKLSAEIQAYLDEVGPKLQELDSAVTK